MMINVCITTLNCYDLLRTCLRSLQWSTRPYDEIFLIDNGRQPDRVAEAIVGIPRVYVVDIEPLLQPGYTSLSLAQSLNWFLKMVPEERLISHDDCIFGPESVRKLVETPGDYVLDADRAVILQRDSCVEKVGYLDETISPGYYMYEDCDYQHRMALQGIFPVRPKCDIIHTPSRTFDRTSRSPEQLAEHHRKFLIAQANYVAKWGGLPETGPDGLTV